MTICVSKNNFPIEKSCSAILHMCVIMLPPSFILVVKNLQIKDNRLEVFWTSYFFSRLFHATYPLVVLFVVINSRLKRRWQIADNVHLFVSSHFSNSTISKGDPMEFLYISHTIFHNSLSIKTNLILFFQMYQLSLANFSIIWYFVTIILEIC